MDHHEFTIKPVTKLGVEIWVLITYDRRTHKVLKYQTFLSEVRAKTEEMLLRNKQSRLSLGGIRI